MCDSEHGNYMLLCLSGFVSLLLLQLLTSLKVHGQMAEAREDVRQWTLKPPAVSVG